MSEYRFFADYWMLDLFRSVDRILDPRPEIALVATERVAKMLQFMPAEGVLEYEKVARPRLPNCEPETFQRVISVTEPSLRWAVAAAFSRHPNGYVRESAVAVLSRGSSEQVLPYLWLRLNDWVPTIRILAVSALQRQVLGVSPEKLIDWTRLFRRARVWGRGGEGIQELRQQVELRLLSHEAESARREGLHNLDPEVRRESLRLCLRATPSAAGELAEFVVRSGQQTLVEVLTSEARSLPSPQKQEVARQLLFQPHLRIRAWAQSTLRRDIGRSGLASLYREALGKGGRSTRAALYGIGECGGASDIAAVIPWLDDERTWVVRAALYALANLDMESRSGLFVELLGSPRRRIADDAAAWLERFPHLIERDRARLLELVDESPLNEERVRHVLAAALDYRRRFLN